MKKLLFTSLISFGLTLISHIVSAAVPILAYSTPNNYTVGTAIPNLSPNNTGGAVAASLTYSTTGTTILAAANGLSNPYGLAVDPSGNVYVVNFTGNNVTEYSTTGIVSTFGSSTNLSGPIGIVFDSFGNAYVLNKTGNTIVEYTGGVYQSTIVTAADGLNAPTGIAIDLSNNIYVGNSGNNTITKYTTAGGASILTFNTRSASYPVSAGISVDAAGKIYVVDNSGGSYIDTYSATGTYITEVTSAGTNSAIYLDPTGNIFTTATGSKKAFGYATAGGAAFATETGFTSPRGVVTDQKGNLYVADYTLNTVTKYAPTSGYFLSGKLPLGLSFSGTTGVISGTPSIAYSGTYTVTGWNASGSGTSNTFTINCNVPPTIAYSPNAYTYGVGTPITAVTPTTTGSPNSFSISPSLLTNTGLSFNTATGIISGTPTIASVAVAYTVTATNTTTGLSATATITITVNPLPTISYTPNSYTYTDGTAIATVTPATTGSPTSYAISPNLNTNTGLTFSTTNGTITGTPTTISAAVNYTVTATNAAGSATTTITITVNYPPSPTISYTGSPYTYTVGTAITALTPAVTNSPTSYSISPSLNTNTGLTFNTTTGVISGTPTTASTGVTYTISASNANPTAGTTTINITVYPKVPTIAYTGSPFTYYTSAAIPTLTPTTTNTPTSFSIIPDLTTNTGLSFNTTTGQISGTPTIVSGAVTYTITATNANPTSGTTNISITVLGPPTISYTGSPYTYITGTAITTLNPAVTNSPTTYSISPNLTTNTGLTFSTTTGKISGTPTIISAAVVYTITATNPAGPGTTTITITCNPPSPIITYTTPNTWLVGTAYTLSPTNTGGVVSTWSITGTLPAGVSFNTANGVISGTPTAAAPTTTYTVTATNVTGSSSKNVVITVNQPAPVISYNSPNVYVSGATVSLSPTNSEPAVTTSYAVTTGTLPTGLTLNTSTGLISGTVPTITTSSTTTVTITAYTGTSQGSTDVAITYNPLPPVISYTNPAPYTVGNTISPLTPSNSGGPVSTTGTYAPGVVIEKAANGLNGPYGMAVDTSGNVFVANKTANSITEYSTTGAITSYYLGGGLGPVGLVYDALGNAYVLNETKKTVVEYAGGNFAVAGTTIVTGLNAPTGIAIDASGYLYIANSGSNNILKYAPAGGAPILTITPPNGFFNSATVSAGIAVDAAGNIYAVDDARFDLGNFYYGASVDIYNAAGTYIGSNEFGNTPSAISIDAAGNIYLTDNGSNTATVYTANFASTIITETGYNTPEGIVSDGAGDFFVSDYSNNTVTEYSPVKGYYLTGTLPPGLVFNTTTGVVSGRPQKTFAPTTYTVTAYNISGKSTTTFRISCGANPPVITYTPSTVMCVQNVAISNLSPVLTGGPVMQAGFSTPGTALAGAAVSAPWGMTKDAAGDIWAANYGNSTVVEYSPTGTFMKSYTVAANPTGVALDGSGYFYVANSNGRVYKYLVSTGAVAPGGNPLITAIRSNGGNAYGIAADASGNLYISDQTDGIVWKYTASTATTAQLIVQPTGGILQPAGIAVDAYGNIYIVDLASNALIEYNANGTFVTKLVYPLNNAYSLYIDSQGDYFIGDEANQTVTEYNISGTLVGTLTLAGSSPRGIVTDASGNLYVADYNKNTITKYPPFYYTYTGTLPAGILFSNVTGTFSGTPTATFPNTSITVTAYGSDGGNGTAIVIFSCTASYDWIGAVSNDWNNVNNWESKVVPPAGKSPAIGVKYAFNFQPVVGTSTSATTLDSLKFGNFGGKAPILTINSGYQLTFNNIVKISDANSGTTPYVATIAGAGTITTNNLSVIATTAAASTYSEAISSSINLLKITGNVNLTSSFSTYAYNAGFNVTGGVTSLTSTGLLNTNNAAGSTSTFSVTGGTLQVANSNFLSGLSATGTNIATFNNAGATIEYSGASQTVYTDAPIPNLSNTLAYTNIKFSGTGIKTPTAGNLYIPGDFTNALTINDASDYVALTGTPVYFNGTIAQNIYAGNGTGTTFKNITFNGTNTTTIKSGNAYVASNGTLTMSGSALLAAGGFLTLNSDASGSAAIAPITSGNPISGNVNVQRYITGERGYRLMSSPVYAGTDASSNKIYSVNYLVNSLYVTGTGSGFSATGNPSLFLYDEGFVPQYTTFFNSNFVAISSLTGGTGTTPTYTLNTNGAGIPSANIPVGNGYYNFFRGNLSEGTANLTNSSYPAVAATVTATDLLTQGQVTVADWYSPSSAYLGAVSQNLNLIGNPYASAIDLGTVATATTTSGVYMTPYNGTSGVSKFIYELNPASGSYGQYITDGSLPPTNGASQYIASGQAFFVQAFGANAAQVIFNENGKATSTNATVPGLMVSRHVLAAAVNTGNINPLLRLKMTLDSVHNEESLLTFNPAFKAQYVFNEDAPHKKGAGLVGFSSTSSDNIDMAVNAMPLLQTQTIPLNVYATNDGLYTIGLEQLHQLPNLYDIWLMDAYKKDSLDIKHNPVYSFNVLNADTNSFGTKRFTLVIRQNPALMVHLLSFAVNKVTPGDQVVWTTENEQNYTNFAVQRSTDGGKTFTILDGLTSSGQGTYTFLDKNPVIGANSYRLQLTDLNGTISYSNVVTIMYANTGNQIAINGFMLYPNPTSSTVNLAIDQSNTTQTAGSAAVSYNIKIINNLGSVIKTAVSSQPDWQADVSTLVPGTYFIQVTNASTNTVVGKSAFVKL